MKMLREVAVGCMLLICIVYCQRANAASAEIYFEISQTPADSVAAGAPARATVLDGFVRTDADILSIGKVLIESPGPLFNVDPPFGSDTRAPDPFHVSRELLALLYVDSWITTPGDTWLLGPGLDETDGTSTWGDLSRDGATFYNFARLTFPPGAKGRFSGEISVAGPDGPESFPFSIVVPEPSAAMLLSVGVLVCATCQERGR